MSSDVKKLQFLGANRKNEVEGLKCGDTLTEQQWKDSCDVNFIVKQYAGIGMSADQFLARMNEVMKDAGQYLDVSDINDLSTYHVKYEQAMQSFEQNVPAAIRDKFGNDAGLFYKFVQHNPEEFKSMLKDFKNYNAPSVDAVQAVGHATAEGAPKPSQKASGDTAE